MATSRVPALIDALLAAAHAALDSNEAVQVYDGYGVSGNSGDFLMIGVENPNSPDMAFSASSKQDVATLGTTRPRDENGSVLCAAYSWNGNANQKLARDTAYGYMAVIEAALRADPNMGIAAGGNFIAGMGDLQRLSQNQSESGADALLVFNVRFFARI